MISRENIGFGEAAAVQVRDITEGATLIVGLLFILLQMLMSKFKKGQEEEVKMNKLQKTMSKFTGIVPTVKLFGMIAYLSYVVQSWVKTGSLPITVE